MIRVGVIGANGRMGRLVCRAVEDDPDLDLVAAIDRSNVGTPVSAVGGTGSRALISGDLEALQNAEVAVDFTHPDVVMDNVRWAIDHGVHIVVGTSGVTPEDLEEIRLRLEKQEGRSNAMVVPNFAIGAVLAQRFSAMAARHFSAVEIIELHHDRKADAPSGTAMATARRLAEARREAYRGPGAESLEGSRGGDLEGVRVHSVRLPGLVAHQEVIFGAPGELLTIRHDSMDRVSFLPGVLAAVKAISNRPGLTLGLEPLLEEPSER